MASGAVWGIDIGQCALKALRCRAHEDPDKIVADAFDYIEYPKILSQPGSDPVELISEALKQFLSRNSVLGDRVAMSVSGQAGLARFIKLPPVEAKKIPDIVKYEAKQQIPFDLNDVIWDYQRMGGGADEEGFALETEVGLFAMKREAVFRALDPFIRAGIEVDIVQLTPLVLYNFMLFDQLSPLPTAEEYDSDNPPESLVVISLGTDATDLVISNGFRVWQRSVPLGGSHFTKALTKELKLTFAKAEHLKRNATTAADPKAVFQAMRPVFGDLLTELQRSISYFSNLDRSAKIGRVLALGNAMKLPGLRRYLSQSLGFEIEKLDSFRCLTGSQVVAAPSFQENMMSFGVAYGLALQGLAKSGVHTNLLPKEIIYDRLIKRKKPWAVAAASLLMLGCGISFGAYSMALGTVEKGKWQQQESSASQLSKEVMQLKGEADKALGEFKSTDAIGQHLVGNVEGRIRWLELLRAFNECLPPSGEDPKVERPKDAQGIAKSISDRKDLHIVNFECQQTADVAAWWAGVKPWDQAAQSTGGQQPAAVAPVAPPGVPGGAPPGGPSGTPPMGGAAPSGQEDTGPKGPGWIIRVAGYHYHNLDPQDMGAQYIRNTLIKNLRTKTVKLPSGEGGAMEEIALSELGVGYPVLVNPTKVENEEIQDPNAVPDGAQPGRGGGMGDELGMPGARTRGAAPAREGSSAPGVIKLQRFDFVVHFCWQPKTPTERLAAKKAKEAGEKPGEQTGNGNVNK